MNINFYINEKRIKEPLNWKELSIELNFDKDSPNARVSINEWDLGLGGYQPEDDGAILSNNHITDGLTGGVGIFEGLPFRIELEQGSDKQDVFNGYLDLTGANIDCDLVVADSIEDGGVDWLNDVADSVSYEFLFEKTNLLNEGDFVPVPYVINSIPKAGEAFLLTLTAFVTVQTIRAEIQAISEMAIETSNPLSAISGVLKIALRIVFVGTLIITVIKLIVDAVNLIIQPVKYHKGMFIKDLLRIGCEHFGLEFESTIFDSTPWNKALILPNQNELPDLDDGLLGFLKPDPEQTGYYNGTFGELLRSLKIMFNAKIVINDGVLRFERRDFNLSTPIFELPPIEREGFTVNADEFLSNIYIEFLTDLNDKNTIQDFEGTVAQITVLPKKIINKRMVLTKGFERRSIPFALGKRKESLTVPEKIIKNLAVVIDPIIGSLIKVVNAIIDVINGIITAIKKLINALNKIPGINISFNPPPIKPITYTPLGDLIQNRIGMLMLENDFIRTSKILLVNEANDPLNTKLTSDNQSVVNSVYLHNNFHFIDSFDPVIYDKTNQHKLFEIDNVPFCYDDFVKVKNNNKLLDGEDEGEIDSLRWNIFEQTSAVNFRINEIYTRNLETQVITGKKSNPNV
jgi:hypothetical protein